MNLAVGRRRGWVLALATLGGCVGSPPLVDCNDEANASLAACQEVDGTSTTNGSTTLPGSSTASSPSESTDAPTSLTTMSTLPDTETSSTTSTDPTTTTATTSTTDDTTGTDTSSETTSTPQLPPAGECAVDLSAGWDVEVQGGDERISNGMLEIFFEQSQNYAVTELIAHGGADTPNLMFDGPRTERFGGVQAWPEFFSYQQDGGLAPTYVSYDAGGAAIRTRTDWEAGDMSIYGGQPTNQVFIPDGRWLRSEHVTIDPASANNLWFNAYLALDATRFAEVTSDASGFGGGGVVTLPADPGVDYFGLYPAQTSNSASTTPSQDVMHFCARDATGGYAVGFGAVEAFFSADDFGLLPGDYQDRHGLRSVRTASAGNNPALAFQYDFLRDSAIPLTAFHVPLFSMVWADDSGDACTCIREQFRAWSNPPNLVVTGGALDDLAELDIEYEDYDNDGYAEHGGYYAIDIEDSGTGSISITMDEGQAVPTVLLRLEQLGSSVGTQDIDPRTVTATLDGAPLVLGTDFEVQPSFAGGVYLFLGRQLTDEYAFEISY